MVKHNITSKYDQWVVTIRTIDALMTALELEDEEERLSMYASNENNFILTQEDKK